MPNHMKKLILLIAATLFLSGTFYAQAMITYDGLKLTEPEKQQSSQGNGYSFTRGRGFFIRPEFYRGFFATFGYQFNPYVQSFLNVGYGDDLTFTAGARVYTSDKNWAGMIDSRFGINGYGYILTLVGGASYKDLDFGLGAQCYHEIHHTWFVPVITIGWNIRCYQHR